MLNGMQLKQNWSESIFKAGYWRGLGFIEKIIGLLLGVGWNVWALFNTQQDIRLELILFWKKKLFTFKKFYDVILHTFNYNYCNKNLEAIEALV